MYTSVQNMHYGWEDGTFDKSKRYSGIQGFQKCDIVLNLILFEIAYNRGNIRLDNKSDNIEAYGNETRTKPFYPFILKPQNTRRFGKTMKAGNAYLLDGAIYRCVPHFTSIPNTFVIEVLCRTYIMCHHHFPSYSSRTNGRTNASLLPK